MTLKHPMCPPTQADPDLYVKTDITPEAVFQAIGRLREEAQDEIDRLLTFLNETDGYSTTELEPSLGSIEKHPGVTGFAPSDSRDGHGEQINWAAGANDDREDEHDGTEPDEDLEPSIGSTNPTIGGSQSSWASGASNDYEDEHDGREPDVDDEQSDTGIGDMGGLLEQCSGTNVSAISRGNVWAE